MTTSTGGPRLSEHFQSRQPSAIRVASIRFAERQDETQALNVAIGNVSLPMHPAMVQRAHSLGSAESPFAEGVVRYTSTVGLDETRQAFLNILASGDIPTEGLQVQVTDGGSQAMELVIAGCCGPAGSRERPLMLIDAAYTNYKAFAQRLGRRTVSIQRELRPDGTFALPSMDEIAGVLKREAPGAMVVIPYDNPTGQLYEQSTLVELARLCVDHDTWLIADEAYRELHYRPGRTVSVWKITEAEVPGIGGRRIGIETASKVWSACGLRIGALVTDNVEFHQRAVAENTASLCSNHIGQWIFGALAHQSHEELHHWYERQRAYYGSMLARLGEDLRAELEGVIVSRPDAALYSVIDVREIVPENFDALDFVLWCAEEGEVEVERQPWTLLTAPMAGFYDVPTGEPNPGRTQMRVAFVENPERMAMVPKLFARLLRAYLAR
jgi:aspartate aminotransferase